MGGIVSAETRIEENGPLRKLSGLEPVEDNDPFWNNLLSFNLKIDDGDKEQLKAFEDALEDLMQALMCNTQTTGNFSSFIRVFLRRSSELEASEHFQNKIFLWQTANSLIILQYVCKFLTQRMTEAEFVKTFDHRKATAQPTDGLSAAYIEESSDEEDEAAEEGSGSDEDSGLSTIERFLNVLCNIVIDLPVNDLTMTIHVEAIKCLIILLSSQLYHEKVATSSLLFSHFITGTCSKRAPQLTKALLRNYLSFDKAYKENKKAETGSLVLGLASSMWSMVTMAAGLDDGSDEPAPPPVSLGSVSILLLLNLACHSTTVTNPFKETLAAFQNAQEVSTIPSETETFKFDYNGLYERLCRTASEEPPMLLLYVLLHRNIGFRNYVLSRINLENLVMPVLRILHEGVSSAISNSHHMYLALIVILILSEDDFFCKIIHETLVQDVKWMESERPVREISLGGLTAMVFIRTIQKNAIKMKDRYLHTNCLAALANMSASFKHLAPVVCQKLISLLELLTKRHAKMVEHMRMSAELDVVEDQPINFHDDITALEEGIRTLLEIINSALTASLRYNPHLIYTLLYHRTLFDSYQHHPMFQDLLANISMVISHFSSKVVHVKAGDGATMMEIIEKEAIAWPTDRLTKFPELKFRYVEDENTIDFFVPYVWRLCLQHSDVYFEPTRVKLFNALVMDR